MAEPDWSAGIPACNVAPSAASYDQIVDSPALLSCFALMQARMPALQSARMPGVPVLRETLSVDRRIEIQVPDGTRRTRLEEFLFGQFPGLSRMYLRRIVRDEKCEVNGRLENV